MASATSREPFYPTNSDYELCHRYGAEVAMPMLADILSSWQTDSIKSQVGMKQYSGFVVRIMTSHGIYHPSPPRFTTEDDVTVNISHEIEHTRLVVDIWHLQTHSTSTMPSVHENIRSLVEDTLTRCYSPPHATLTVPWARPRWVVRSHAYGVVLWALKCRWFGKSRVDFAEPGLVKFLLELADQPPLTRGTYGGIAYYFEEF